MRVLGQIRKAVFGETWELPLGVALLLGVAALLEALSADAWRDWGGLYLALGAAFLLIALVRSATRAPVRSGGQGAAADVDRRE